MRNIKIINRSIRRFAGALPRIIKHTYRRHPRRSLMILTPLSIIIGVGISSAVVLIAGMFFQPNYQLGTAGNLLPEPGSGVAEAIKHDKKEHAYTYKNTARGNTLAAVKETSKASTSGVSITANQDPAKGVSVTDETNGVGFSMSPEFKLSQGRLLDNHVVYPLHDGTGWTVYSILATGVKEDILLTKATADTQSYSFNLNLGDSLEARTLSDGSIGIYGNNIFSGNVSTGTDADANLLQKARSSAPKDTLIFRIPKPVITESGGKKSGASALYILNGKHLTIKADGLLKAQYPLSIDPSIYVVTAQQFMQGNNESNIDFDVSNKLIKKTATTGARFNAWNSTMGLPSLKWGAGTVAAGGFMYSVGGTSLNGQIYNTQGASTLEIPAGTTSITVKAWGGGGGGGTGAAGAGGGNGGGGAYLTETLAVTPGETLDLYVGGGGGGGSATSGSAGGGGGHTSIYRGSTLLALVGGGGGGGGATNSVAGGAGGAAGNTGVAGGTSGAAGAGGGGSVSTGGAGGSGGNNPGTAGSSLNGGLGADGRNGAGSDGGGVNGGLATGGAGGITINNSRGGGGGGGSGYFGGGGGSASNNTSGGAGGGGGSSIAGASATGVTISAGTGTTAANASDSSRAGAGTGGTAAPAGTRSGNGSNGIIIVSFGSGNFNPTVGQSVSWAQLDTSTGEINSPDPGSGACSGWCTTSAYNLPAPRKNFSLVAYNGFLYAMGGTDQAGNTQKSVYISKLGANGEPQLWSPTSTDQATWSYWYRDTDLTSSATSFAATAYNNRMYIAGGTNGANFYSSVYYANINPNGRLGSLTTSTSLPLTLGNGDIQIYNDRLYYIGGQSALADAPRTSVYYNKINADGSLNSWNTTSSLLNGRVGAGTGFTAIWGAYLYISGGCTAVNGSGYCTSISSDTQLASINADGSLDAWGTIGGVSNGVIGSNVVTWRNRIYMTGGCAAQNTSTGACDIMSSASVYGDFNVEGDASTVAQSTANGTSTCTGGSPTNCNLPGSTSVGNMLSAAIITNGYLYVIGGCTNNACSTTSGNVAYTAISSTGTMTKPATCPTGTYTGGTWCVDTSNIVSGGIAATSPVVFNNRIYLVGGLTGNANNGAIYRSNLNPDGSISSWTNQSLGGLNVNSISYSFAYARANPADATNNPGNLYIFGGCTTSSAAGCTAYSQAVYKCSIQSAGGTVSGCSTSGQLQIGTIPGDTAAGLGIMSGTVYANYVYLVGGVSPNLVDLPTVRYAKIDSNNNIVTAGSTASWVESPNKMEVGRRRAAAFGYNGYIYAVGGYDGSSGNVLADIEFIKVNVSDGSLGSASRGFVVSSVSINQRWGLTVPVSNSYAYVIGGCTAGASPGNCTARTDVVQTFQIFNNDNGAPAGYASAPNAWTNAPSRIGHSSVILNNYIYTAGGCTSTTDCTNAISDVSYAPIDVNGTIGAWAGATSGLPAVRTWGKLEAAGGSLYYMGGQSSSSSDYRNEVYYATPGANGNISTWGTASNGLPAGRSQIGASVWNNRLYVVGGKGTGTGCTNGVCNSVYISPQLNAGGNITGAWSTSTSINIARSGTTAVAYANNLYIMGGFDGTNYLSDSQFSQLNTTTGSTGTWSYSESLPGPISQGDGFAANGYIYLIGGRSAATTCSPSTLVAPISANTSIASGNKPTGIGAWYSTNQRYSGNSYGAAAAYNDGKAYILGGACGSSLTYVNPVIQQTTLLSQPQIAKYSIAIDTDSDVFPSNWLLNGVDNSIGANWQVKYRSMTNNTSACSSSAMTTWGKETNFGNVTLGKLNAYTPVDASGVSTNCARYYYFNLTVDSSQAFGYPDDVSRGPTITDLTLQFTADPAKRLMHGRTFTGGLQQPIDTPAYSN